MADLTIQVEITTAWKEMSVPVGMADDEKFAVDIISARSKTTVYTAETDDVAQEPADGIVGHPILPFQRNQIVDTRQFEKRAGAFPWVRVDRGAAVAVFTKVN